MSIQRRQDYLRTSYRYTQRIPTTYEGRVYTRVHKSIPTCTQLYTHVYTTSL